MSNEQQDSTQAICMRCGADANWRFVDVDRQLIEITCPDCGRFEVPRAEFEQAEFDITPGEDRR
jgi:DNA-directed RNA polymerase subunit RPC12/RpoP